MKPLNKTPAMLRVKVDLSSNKRTGYINGWDGSMNYAVPKGYTMTGLNSYHSNRKEDRRFRVYYAKPVATIQ